MILGGSWSEEGGWPRILTVCPVTLFGHLPEIEVMLSNDARVVSFQITSGNPRWVLFDRSNERSRWCHTWFSAKKPASSRAVIPVGVAKVRVRLCARPGIT